MQLGFILLLSNKISHHTLKFHRLGLNTKKQLSAILEFSILKGRKGEISKFRKIQIFGHNLASNCCNVRKIHIRRLDLNTKKHFFANFEFSILSGKIAKVRKIQIFEHN